MLGAVTAEEQRSAQVLREVAEDWDLRLGDPFTSGQASVAAAVRLGDGRDAVLKLQVPHRESEHEADALRAWDGDGAIRLLAHDPARHALLLERCVPGTPLSELDQESALDVFIGLLPRLWTPAGSPFRPLADEAAWWSSHLVEEWDGTGRPFERWLIDAALDALRTLAPTQGEQVLLHQDLHADNVLRAEREPWLVIDPKPLAGEREFGIGPIVRSVELGHSRHHVLRRFDRLTAELGLDRERARGWTVAQTVAWSFDSHLRDAHVDTVRWLLDARRR
jgi:streptomycin 6-kinase